MSFVDQLKDIQVSEESLNKKKQEQENLHKKEVIDNILKECENNAKRGKHYMSTSVDDDGNFASWLKSTLSSPQYGFYEVKTKCWYDPSDYDGGYKVSLLVVWAPEGVKEYKKDHGSTRVFHCLF